MNSPPDSVRAGNPLQEIVRSLGAPELRPWTVAVAALVAVSLPLLVPLARFALGSNLYSHIPLMPVIAGYLVWIDRAELPPAGPPLRPRWAVLAGLAALGLLAVYLGLRFSGARLAPVDRHAFAAGSFLLGLLAVSLWRLPAVWLRKLAFPLALLVFMVPFPDAVETMIETVLQHGSADVAYALFQLAGTPLFRNELIFQLPNITLEVAPQCSGIHSTLALFITSLVAGHLFLRSPSHRAVLALVVIPLAFVRNGFRVFTLGELCVRIGPEMIHSFVHHRGGPLFFALSLIPFSCVLFLLVRRERRRPSVSPAPTSA